jgi:hypothetical protein
MRAAILGLGLGLAATAACTSLPEPPAPGTVAVEITSPSPGAELVADSAPTITVTGTVTTTAPDYGALQAWVDGAPVELDANGSFTAEVTPTVGVDHIVVDASDGIGAPVRRELDVLWAPGYLPPVTGTTGFELDDALDLQLGQAFFDGRAFGTTLDLSTDPVVAHDLAAALELILWNVDLASLLPDGLHASAGSSSLDVAIPSVTPAEILVDAQVVDAPEAALDLAIDLNGVYLATTGAFQYGGNTLQIEGGLSADMHASARLALAVQADGTIGVTVSEVTAVVGPLVPMFTGPDANTLDGFIAIGNNDFRALVEGLVQQQLIPTFTDEIPPLLESLLGATDQLLDDVSLTLDAQLGTPVTLGLDGTIGALDVVAGPAIGASPGHVTVRQHVSITTDAAPIHPTSLGALRTTATPVPPPSGAPLQLRLSHDFLNALLHALWDAGLLEGSATFGGQSAVVSAKLPPVVIPTPDGTACEVDGARCDVLNQLGQIEVQLPDFEQTFAIEATAGARVVVDGDTISLAIQETPELVVWETSAVPGLLGPDGVRELVANVVWPQLFGALEDQLHITLPIPDLAALGLDDLSPRLANAQLQLAVRPRASAISGYLGLGADLELQTPHP